ncbi:MAG: FtsX-like permease family protein, partial [Planctomycetota bacterium]
MKNLGFPIRFLWRNAGRRKGRFLLGALGVFVGVTLLTAIQVGLDSLSLAYIDFATLMAGKADAVILPREANFLEGEFFDGEELKRRVLEVEGVAGVAPGVLWGGQVTAIGEAVTQTIAGDPSKDLPFLGPTVVTECLDDRARNRAWDRPLSDSECLLSEALADQLSAEPGDKIRLVDPMDTAQKPAGSRFKVRAVIRPTDATRDLPLGYCVLNEEAAAEVPLLGGILARVIRERRVFTAVLGLDLVAAREHDLGSILVKEDEEGEKSGDRWEKVLEPGECLVSDALADRTGAKPGDRIRLAGFKPPLGVGKPREYKVRAIIKQRGAFPDFIRGFCMVSPEEAGLLADRPGMTTLLGVSFKDRERLYDARDIHQSVLRARAVGERIQEALGLEYRVDMPKCVVLDLRESITGLLRGIFTLFGVVALAIAALLIYSLLSISVEERVRENAILRTLGGKNRFIMSTVVGEGAFLCAAGSVGGVLGGIFLTWLGTQVATAFIETEGFPLEIQLSIQPLSIGLALLAGLLVSLFSSILPARRAVRSTIVEALNAYRALPTPMKIIKERGLDTRLVAAGAVITVFMGFFTFFMPRALASGDPTLLAVILGVILITLLVGVVFLSLGAQPVLERIVFGSLRPWLGTSSDIAERNLKRYRRRNTATALMFTLSVALVLFIASMASIMFLQAGRIAKFLNGADLRVETFYRPTIDFEKELRETEGVERVVRTVTGRQVQSQDQLEWKVRVNISDLVGIRRAGVRIFGAPTDLLDVLYGEDLQFHEGDESAFRSLKGDPGEESPGQVILSRSVASALSVDVGSLVKLRSKVGPHKAYRTARVTAVMDKLPGFPLFYTSRVRARGSGVLVSLEMFDALMGTKAGSGEPGGEGESLSPPWRGEEGEERPEIQWRPIYFVRVKEGVSEVGKKFRQKFGWARMGTMIKDTEEDVKNAERLFYSTQVLFTGILALSVAIALFGLLASMYTAVLERKREVVILKALGMRKRDLFWMFAGETTTLLLTSGILGAITGFILAYMLVSQQAAISELPTPFTVPWIPVIGMIFISIAMGLFGAWL